MAVGGSTNAVMHLIAMARAVDVPLTIDDFQRTSDRVPYLADLRPSGKYVQEDLHDVGGTPAVMKLLLDEGLLTGDCLTITGKTIAENLADLPGFAKGQDVVHPFRIRSRRPATSASCAATSAPTARSPRSPARKACKFTGTANCFDSEEDMLAAMQQQKIKKGDVVVIRYEGPQGGPGMPEMLSPTGAIVGAGLAKDVALITDGRFSGGSAGFIVGHVTPEAQARRPDRAGEERRPDHDRRRSEHDHASTSPPTNSPRRRKAWKAPPYKATRGTLYKYIKNVKSASEGCVTDE